MTSKVLRKEIGENSAFFTNFQFFLVGCLKCTAAKGATEKPAQMPALKFPGGTFVFYSTFFLLPTRFLIILTPALVDE